MQIDYLKNQPQFIDPVTKAWYEEWFLGKNKKTFEQLTEKIATKANIGKIPFIIVAFEKDKFIGSAAIFEHDLDSMTELSPWLAGVFVKEAYRGQGIARQLVERIFSEAKALGFDNLYLHTETAQGFYEKLGCTKIIETINDLDEPTTVYEKTLSV